MNAISCVNKHQRNNARGNEVTKDRGFESLSNKDARGLKGALAESGIAWKRLVRDCIHKFTYTRTKIYGAEENKHIVVVAE